MCTHKKENRKQSQPTCFHPPYIKQPFLFFLLFPHPPTRESGWKWIRAQTCAGGRGKIYYWASSHASGHEKSSSHLVILVPEIIELNSKGSGCNEKTVEGGGVHPHCGPFLDHYIHYQNYLKNRWIKSVEFRDVSNKGKSCEKDLILQPPPSFDKKNERMFKANNGRWATKYRLSMITRVV